MKTAQVTLFFAITLGLYLKVQGQWETCGGDCIFSDDCSKSDFGCMCSYFHCRKIPEGTCGGGCFDDSQCSRYSTNEQTCFCGTYFECITKSEMEKPGYQLYATFLASARGATFRRKINKMKELYKLKNLNKLTMGQDKQAYSSN